MTDAALPLFPPGAAVVVGGSGGLGRAICAGLAESGCDVAFTYHRNAASAASLAQTLEASGRRVLAEPVDVTSAASVAAFLDQTVAMFGRMHSLVLAIGSDISMTYVADIDAAEWTRTLDADLHGSFNVLKAAVPHLRAGGGGAIVAVTSAGLLRHPPKDILSVVPKAGVEALLRGIAREEGRNGIRANSLALGVIEAGLFGRLQERLTPEFVEAMKRNTALRRFGSARDVADAAVFLASSKSAFITGQSLAVDGGYSV